MAPAELEALKKACRDAGVARVTRDLPCVEPFNFDGSVLLPSRWSSVFEEQGLQVDAKAWGRRYVEPLFRKLDEPYPYVACLVADGDRIGPTIDALGLADAHRAFSNALAGFAGKARRIVEQVHRGALIYAGGDDVLAFVSLPEALACADALRRAFENAMATACASLPDDTRPTLSVGLGIGRVMESMGDLLTLGRQAEREAKHDRNALAVIVDKRSGGAHTWRATWRTEPVQALKDAASLLGDRLPSSKVYEIARILRRLPQPDDASGDSWARVLALEVRRVLSRIEGAGLRPEDVGLALDTLDYATLHGQIDAWVERLLVARTFARAAIRGRHSQEAAA